MQKIKKLFNKYEAFIKYCFFGVITVAINLVLYKLFLEINMQYVIASIVSYFIASLVSYYFNLFFVFKDKILKLNEELKRIFKYFVIRLASVVIDTLLLVLLVEAFDFDKFKSKIVVSFIVIVFTFVFNKLLFKKRK